MLIDLDEALKGCLAFRALRYSIVSDRWQIIYSTAATADGVGISQTDWLPSPTAALRVMAEATGDEKLLKMLNAPMRCPSCSQSNEPARLTCIFCGRLMPPATAPSPQEP